MEYAKCDVEDILIQITDFNRGPEAAPLHLLPTVWFRNTWSWGKDLRRPILRRAPDTPGTLCCRTRNTGNTASAGFFALANPSSSSPKMKPSTQSLFNSTNRTPYVKDAFHNTSFTETKLPSILRKPARKMAAHYFMPLGPGESAVFKLRLTDSDPLAGMDSESSMVGTIPRPAQGSTPEVPGTNDFCCGI